jgi:glycosyltransferase involved in cell wall biosynthesis
MKILQVVHGYYPSIGGSQWLAQSLAERLVSRYGDQVTVFTTVAYDMEYFWRGGRALPVGVEQINGVTVRRFPVFNRLSWLRMALAGAAYRLHLPYNDWLRAIQNGPIVLGMTQAVATSGADVVFATAFPLLHMHYALAGAQRAGIPIVFLGALHVADAWGYDREMIYRAIQQADAYIAHTTFERDYLVGRGTQADKIVVIGAGVDADAFASADGVEVRQRYGWGDAPLVGTMGKQTARKRFDVLLKAMPHVWAARPEVHLFIAGAAGPFSPHIKSLIDTFPAEWQVRITVISDFEETEKSALLAACDVFALPSVHESFGIAFAEAWACGKPVIGARVGAISSVIDDGNDGVLVNVDDPQDLARAILELLADQERRARLGRTGQERVLENYTWDVVTERVRAVLCDSIAHHAGSC